MTLTARRCLLGALAAGLGLAAIVLVRSSPKVPSLAEMRAHYRPSEAYLLDRHGALLESRRIDLGVRRYEWTAFADVSPALIKAVIDGEDRRFWRHHGIDWQSALGALRDNFLMHRHRGASTITMQLASLLTSPEHPHVGAHTLGQKLIQMRTALALERRFSKQQILECYLNLLQFRGELQGIGAAAAVLAGKTPAGLSAGESAVLAALLPGPGANPARVAARACARQKAPDELTCEQLRALATLMLGGGIEQPAPERLAPQLSASLLRVPGEHVVTTLDAPVQRVARDALDRHLGSLADRNVRDGAAIVVDNATGDVLAYVGSAGAYSRAAQVDGVRARRQAGSTLKPFLYELAIERRYLTAASLLDDSAVNVDTATGTYLPQDYDHDFKGMVSVRTALGGSLNVPAVRTLMLVGVEPFRARLHALGYAAISEDGDYYGYSLALGSAEVSLWEQAQAYLSLARGGAWKPLRVRATDPSAADVQRLAPAASYVVDDVLSDRAARVVTFGMDNPLNTPYWSAVKTGTSKDMRDNWCVGFTSRYTVAVWVGNFEGDPMHEVSGITGAAPVWRDILDALHANGGSGPPQRPDGVTAEGVEFATGAEAPRREWFLSGTGSGGRIEPVARESQSARILTPANGMVIAVDPDIPAARQRVLITVQGGSPDLVVTLNEATIGHAGRPVLWSPRPGTHHLALLDTSGHVVDRILFTVR